MRVKDAVGRFGEQVAADLVCERGMQILDRNWRGPGGELDIVARDGATLVFVEVKTRSSRAYGLPAEAVDARKAARIRRLAGQWMTAHRDGGGVPFWQTVRFDVVSVIRDRAGSALDVDHLVGAF
ncbi:YraN family protein [uncultured Jatrophihabitans sp.]|uniref:YraN family protein n=1 Tax=uncultured Jatrophihabitans sp. TaxID=1610747 RepID=UPI0035CBA913